MSKYLIIGAAGFLMGMKYRQLGKKRCLRMLKTRMQRMLP